MIFAIGYLSIAQSAPLKEDPRFMMRAAYYAGSEREDPESPGGYAGSMNFPVPIDRDDLKDKGYIAKLHASKNGVVLYIANGSIQDAWIQAADSNILGYLEAKDAQGVWRPIEYHQWYTCGNSYHRLYLPPGKMWTFFRPFPHGSLKSRIRWQMGATPGGIKSNEIDEWIDPSRFQLPAILKSNHTLEMGWRVPTLVPLHR